MEKTEKIYHIYAKGECIYHNLSESKFSETWDMLHKMIDLLDSNLQKEDLEFEELTISKESKEAVINSSY